MQLWGGVVYRVSCVVYRVLCVLLLGSRVMITDKDCIEGCDEVQKGAIEILGHLAGMAESISPFQIHQVWQERGKIAWLCSSPIVPLQRQYSRTRIYLTDSSTEYNEDSRRSCGS